MDEKLFFPRLKDLTERCEKTDTPQFLGFLSETETALARGYFLNTSAKTEFFGGYGDALRNFVCVKPEWCETAEFPITPVTFKYKDIYKLTHRDFLGSVMSLGIEREKIGDILVGNGICVLFAQKEIAKYIVSQTEKVGNVGVTVLEGASEPLPVSTKKEAFVSTVPSSRLDAVVAALCKLSRSKACELIESKLVCVNSFICDKATKKISSSDVVSVRKYGRYNIVSTDETSKKGRTVLKYEKYV